MNKTIKREDLAKFGNLEILAKQVVEGFITGMHKSPFHGFSVEFAEHRLYNKGESTKHIDWKLYARSEKLFTKKYEEETNLRCQLVLDCSSSMLFKGKNDLTKLEYSVYCIASIIEMLKKQRDAVGISLFDEKLTLHTPAKSSTRHHRYLYQMLEQEMKIFSESDLRRTSAVKALHDVAELCHKRSLVIIFSDLLDDPDKLEEMMQAIQHLKHNKHEVILFHVVDKEMELNFELENRPHLLIDMETGEKVKLQPSQIKERYQEKMQAYFEDIKLKCGQYAIDFVSADINESFHQVLLAYMLKRQKLY